MNVNNHRWFVDFEKKWRFFFFAGGKGFSKQKVTHIRAWFFLNINLDKLSNLDIFFFLLTRTISRHRESSARLSHQHLPIQRAHQTNKNFLFASFVAETHVSDLQVELRGRTAGVRVIYVAQRPSLFAPPSLLLSLNRPRFTAPPSWHAYVCAFLHVIAISSFFIQVHRHR